MPQSRHDTIQHFLNQHRAAAPLQALAGDASSRRYYRLASSEFAARFGADSLILMDSPSENIGQFLKICEILNKANIPCVHIFAYNLEHGLILMTDIGEISFFEKTQYGDGLTLYQQAIDLLIAMQKIPTTSLPAYDAALLQSEMALFTDWLLDKHLHIKLNPSLQQQLVLACDFLCQESLSQPRIFVHRDYHCRNIFVDNDKLFLLDFQDANCGALMYDLASLLRDCYIKLEEEMLESLLTYYYRHSPQLHLHSSEQVRAWFDLCGMQRHLKVAGIFARLYHRDGKSNYIKDIAAALQYLLAVCPLYPQTQVITKIIVDYQLIEKCKQSALSLADENS